MDLFESLNHNLRTPRNVAPVDEKINRVLSLCEEVSSRTGKDISFDNTWTNHFTLSVDGQKFIFNTYSSVVDALELLLVFI
jgi:hypothetical protein